jgi:hypothetical protein
MANLLLRAFFLPGDLVCTTLKVGDGEDRMMIRTFVDILFWNAVVVIIALVFFA